MGVCLKREDLGHAQSVLQSLPNQWLGASFEEGMTIARIIVVDESMPCTAGTAVRMFRALADAQINVVMFAASEIRTSCVVTVSEGIKALQVIHKAVGPGGEVKHQAQGTEEQVLQ